MHAKAESFLAEEEQKTGEDYEEKSKVATKMAKLEPDTVMRQIILQLAGAFSYQFIAARLDEISTDPSLGEKKKQRLLLIEKEKLRLLSELNNNIKKHEKIVLEFEETLRVQLESELVGILLLLRDDEKKPEEKRELVTTQQISAVVAKNLRRIQSLPRLLLLQNGHSQLWRQLGDLFAAKFQETDRDEMMQGFLKGVLIRLNKFAKHHAQSSSDLHFRTLIKIIKPLISKNSQKKYSRLFPNSSDDTDALDALDALPAATAYLIDRFKKPKQAQERKTLVQFFDLVSPRGKAEEEKKEDGRKSPFPFFQSSVVLTRDNESDVESSSQEEEPETSSSSQEEVVSPRRKSNGKKQ